MMITIDFLFAAHKKILLKQTEGKKIVIFGTGSSNEKVCGLLPKKVDYFVDNDSSKRGSNIYNPEHLLEEDKDKLIIIIASQYFAEIAEQLETMGFEENKHFWNGLLIVNNVESEQVRENNLNSNIIGQEIFEKENGRSLYKTKFNDLFWLNDTSEIDKSIKKSGIFDPYGTKIVNRILKPGNIVLDIGANIGYYSVIMSRLVGDSGKVISFEPTKHYGDVLLRNLEANQITNCQVQLYGLSEASQSLEINIGLSTASMHWFGFGNEKPLSTEKIKLKRLDDVVSSLGIDKIDFIKIDVDGHEPAFLAGAWETILKYKPVILLEVSHRHYLNYGMTAWDFYSILKDKQFYIYTEDTLSEITSKDEFLYRCGNFSSSCDIVICQNRLSPEVISCRDNL